MQAVRSDKAFAAAIILIGIRHKSEIVRLIGDRQTKP